MRRLFALLGLTGWVLAASCGGRVETIFDSTSAAGSTGEGAAPDLAAGTAGMGDSGAEAGGGGVAGGAAGSAGDAPAGSGGQLESTSPNDVVGTLVSIEGAPVNGATVEIAGTKVITDDTGSFRVHDVPATYDAFVVSKPDKAVDIYHGLTTRTPHFALSVGRRDAHHAAVYGRLVGGAGFSAPGHIVVVDAANGRDFGIWGASQSGANYSFGTLSWQSASASTFTLAALQWSAAHGVPTGYDGWGTKQVTLSDGVDLGRYGVDTPATDIVLSPLSTRMVSGIVSSPDDCVRQVWAGAGQIEIVSQPLAENGRFSYLLPQALPGAVLQLNGICYSVTSARTVTSYGALGALNDVSFDLPKAPSLTEPGETAVGIDRSTPISWETNGLSLSDVFFSVDGVSINRYLIGGSTAFPDLSRFGIVAPPDQPVSWQVSTVDIGAKATGTTEDALHESVADITPGDHLVIGQSEIRSFTLSR